MLILAIFVTRLRIDLRLDHLYVIHPGELRFALDDGITALPAMEIPTLAGTAA
jgi:hypothetical protein